MESIRMWIVTIVLIPAFSLYCVKLHSMDTCTFYDSMMNMRVTNNDKMLFFVQRYM